MRSVVLSHVGVLVGVFVAGAATTLLALYVALRTAPGVIMADDMVQALVVVAETPLSRFPHGATVYVRSSLQGVLLEDLQRKYPALTLRPYASRPADNCGDGNSAPARCERDDFVKLEVLSSPARATMLVAVETSRSFGQVLLVRFLGQWRVMVYRSYPL